MKRIRIYAYIKAELKQWLDSRAERTGDSQSEIIEEALKLLRNPRPNHRSDE